MSSDRFVSASIKTIFKYIKEFEKTGIFLGIPSEFFFTPKSDDTFMVKRYGQMLETPLGVAAGPHTQLSQNIISAWLTGARYMELKTVQVLDELDVTKPCIDMSDEGYNCEWSQELKLNGSFEEYLNAWVLIHVLRDMFGHTGENGFVFNMSVGYNMEGILSPSVQKFLDKMSDCSDVLDDKIAEVAKFYPAVKNLPISPCITNNLTVSTMHGCPPEEIEKIGQYFIEERKFDTTIKLNPTLLGAKKLREILNERLGFEIEVPDLAFDHDLKYADGVKLIISLKKSSKRSGAAFNLKLTNTLETSNISQKLPKKEKMLYMSGRALHPISVNLAAKLQKEFKGKLDISFSAGADCFNIADILKSGLTPVTICSDILKPGGYGRLAQYIEQIRGIEIPADSFEYLTKYANEVIENPLYKKQSYPYESVKTERELGFFDCAEAPCMTGCPAGQEIPRYLEYTARGEFEKAYKTIAATNPFPNVQGRVCDHVCQTRCTRMNYEKPILIREVKRYIAEKFEKTGIKPSASNGLKVSVIGSGPAGLSCSAVLAREGFQVDVYEAKDFPGGMAADGIPVFRLDDGSLAKDIRNITALGVKLHLGKHISKDIFDKLRNESDFTYIAVGAQKDMPLNIDGIDSEGVYDQLSFLSKVRRGEKLKFGKNIIIIGAGNSAMDAARTARRLASDGEVTIVYRRTKREMPCDAEEIRGAMEEGIKIVELASPEAVVSVDNQVTGLKVSRMKLGKPDSSGRARPLKIDGSEYVIDADTIITAIGQQVVLDFLPEESLKVNPETYETQMDRVYAGGDAYRGASSLINAIADGQKAAFSILDKAGVAKTLNLTPEEDRVINKRKLMVKQASRDFGAELPEKKASDRLNFDLFMDTLSDEAAKKEASRCLQCDLICNVCTTVCPNRSNFFIETDTAEIPIETLFANGSIKLTGSKKLKQQYQIVNIGDFCNECGNCTTFCPSAGRPFMDKPKFHITRESFDLAELGFHITEEDTMLIKNNDEKAEVVETDSGYLYQEDDLIISLDKSSLRVEKILMNNISSDRKIGYITEYVYLFKMIKTCAPFSQERI